MKKIISLALSLIFVLSIGAVSVSAQTMTNNQIMLSLLPTDIDTGEPVESTYNGSYCDAYILHEPNIENKQYVELKNFTENLVKDCTTDLEKVYAISNWVYDNIDYKFGLLAGNSMETVYGVFENKMGNCECLTRLTNYMLYLVDVPTAIITSHKDGHEWGCALVNGEWIIVDSTNNYIGNDYLERFTIECIAFSTSDNLCYTVSNKRNGIWLTGRGFYADENGVVHPEKNATITIPSFVSNIEQEVFQYWENGCMLDNDELVIKGEKGTYAETYVLKNYACVNYSKNNTFTAYKKHNYKETILKNATCKKDGLKKCVCTICGEKTKRVIKAHHNFKRVSKKSTVFNSGFKNYKICKDCGYEKPFEGKDLSRLSLKNTSFKIIAEKEKIKITYKKISGANGFIVRYKKVGDNKYTYKKFKTTKSAKKYIKNLKKNKKYYISFQVYKNENNKKVLSQWSKTRKITVK